MNFVLHHALARVELDCAVAAVGAMLPDLWRMADRRMRVRAVVKEPDDDDAMVRLGRGIAHHLETDRWFHECEVFVAGEERATAALRAIGAPKLALFAHVVWEMCLDGAWVLRSGNSRASEIGGAIRDGWRQAERAAEVVAERYGGGRLSPSERARMLERLELMRAGLESGAWIAGYADPTGLCQRLEGMRVRRFGLPPLAGAEPEVLRALGEILAAAIGDIDRLLELREIERCKRSH